MKPLHSPALALFPVVRLGSLPACREAAFTAGQVTPAQLFCQSLSGNACLLQCRFPLQQDPDPSTHQFTASPLIPEPSVPAGVRPQPLAGLHEEGGDLWGVSWVQRVEHVGAQLRCSFPALVMPEPGSEGAAALVGLGPTATIPQPQAAMAGCWGCYWRGLVALRSGCRRGCEDTVLCPSHLRHCWLGLLGDTGFSSKVFSTSLAVPAPCRVPPPPRAREE